MSGLGLFQRNSEPLKGRGPVPVTPVSQGSAQGQHRVRAWKCLLSECTAERGGSPPPPPRTGTG